MCSSDGCIKVLLAAEGFGSDLLVSLDGETWSHAGLEANQVEKPARGLDDIDISDSMKQREAYIVLAKVGEVVQECEGTTTGRESNMMLLLAAPAFVAFILAQL